MNIDPQTPEEIEQEADLLSLEYGLLLRAQGNVAETVKDLRPITYNDLFIANKDRFLEKFTPNGVQREFNRDVFGTGNWEANPHGLKSIRRIILKSRQLGMSTNTIALYFMDTIQKGFTKTIIMAHDLPSTIELFKKVHLMHQMLPDDIKARIGKPKASSKYEIFWPDIQSSFLVGTAGSADFGASQTCNNVLLTELPRWPDGAMDSVRDGLMNAVPLTGNIIIESTAQGVGNDFHKQWLDAIHKKSVFKPIFLTWKDFPEYQLREDQWHLLPEPFDPERLSEEEYELKERWNLSNNQMAWRRWKILELKDPDLFPQNFPLYWQEAFRTSGHSFFNNKILARELSRVEQIIPMRGVDVVSAFN